jgi:hypothetical protein
MKQEAAELLKECADDDCSMRSDYSGRGMFGKSTHAVTFESMSDFHTALANAAWALGENSDAELLEELKGLGSDAMGTGIVVY